MPDITVPVPDERVADFYSFFGRWLAGSEDSTANPAAGALRTPPTPKLVAWGNSAQDLADAETLWRKYPARAKAIFSLLMDNAGRHYTGDEIAAIVGIPNGARGVAGALGHPGRQAAELGRVIFSEYVVDGATQAGSYFISVTLAEVFKAARANVEGRR